MCNFHHVEWLIPQEFPPNFMEWDILGGNIVEWDILGENIVEWDILVYIH